MEKTSDKRKEIIVFKGSLKEYAEMLLKDKRGDGSVINLGEIHESILKALTTILNHGVSFKRPT